MNKTCTCILDSKSPGDFITDPYCPLHATFKWMNIPMSKPKTSCTCLISKGTLIPDPYCPEHEAVVLYLTEHELGVRSKMKDILTKIYKKSATREDWEDFEIETLAQEGLDLLSK